MIRRFLVLVLLLVAVPASAETRIALVVGVTSYDSRDLQPLPNAVADAKAIGSKLQSLGFDTDIVLDPTRGRLSRALNDLFLHRAKIQADTALIYFAGHGLQADGQGYLLARDSSLVPKNEIEMRQEVNLSGLIQRLAEAKIAILLLDACRNTPGLEERLAWTTDRTLTAGLPRLGPLKAQAVVSYSAEPGLKAIDSYGNRPNSPYAEALLDYLDRADIELAAMLQGVSRYVQSVTSGTQNPMFEDRRHPGTTFYFRQSGRVVQPSPLPKVSAPDQVGRISAREAMALLTGKTGAARSSALSGLIAKPGLLDPIHPSDALALLGDIPDDAGRRRRALTALLPLLDLPIDPRSARRLLDGLSDISWRTALSDMIGCLARPLAEQQAQYLVEGIPRDDIPRFYRQLTSASTAQARCGGGG